MVDTWNTNTNTYPDVDPANDYQVGEQTGSYVGTGTTTGTTWPGAGMGSGNTDNNTTNNTTTNNQDVSTPVVDSEQAKIDYLAQQREQARLDAIQNLKSLYASTMSSPGPLGGADYEGLDLGEILGSFGADPTALTQKDEDGNVILDKDGNPLLHSSMNYANMPSGGQIPMTDWDKLNFLSHLGIGTNQTGKEGLGAFFAVDSSGNAILDSSGNLIMTGLGNTMSDNFNEIVYGTPSTINPEKTFTMEEQFENLADNYWKSRDEQWYGSDYWDDYLGEYYGPTEQSAYEKNKRWQQKSLGEILQEGPVGFSDLQRIYGEELSETSGNPFAAVAQYNKQGAFSPSFGESIITEYS